MKRFASTSVSALHSTINENSLLSNNNVNTRIAEQPSEQPTMCDNESLPDDGKHKSFFNRAKIINK